MVMANKNKIKYVSGNDILNGALTNNNVALGVDMGLDYGPTTDSGYWQGVTPNNGGYTIYYLNGEEQPRIEVAKDDTALIFFANSFGADNVDNVTDALNYFKSTSGYFITNRKYDSITTSGMTLMYDPGLVQSYPKSGTTMDNLGTLANGANTPQMTFNQNGAPVDFVDEKGGALRFYNNNDGDGSYAMTDFNNSSNDFTYNVWIKTNSFNNNGWNVITSRESYQQIGIFDNGYIDFYDESNNVDIFNDGGDPQITLGKWHNITVRHIEGETTQLYLDNVLIGEDTSNVNLYNESMNRFTIACSNLGPDYFDGQIGHVAYYERALSVAEIEKNYNALYDRYYGAQNGESLLFLSKMPTNNNFGYVVLDPSTGMALGPFDTGVDVNNFYEDDFYPLSHSGYVIIFANQDNNNLKTILYIDSFGTIVETYTTTTSNFNRDDADGKVVVTNEYDNGVIKFFDGLAVGTYTYDTNNEEAYFDWNWDAASKDKTFVIYSRNTNTNDITWKLANAQTGVISVGPTYNASDYSTEPIVYFNGDFVIIPMYSYIDSKHTNLYVYKTDGTLIHNEDISSLGLNSWNGDLYGTGKFSFVYTNNSDYDVDYHMYAYNEITDTFVSGSHARGANFPSYNTYSLSYDWANQSYLSEKITYMFYNNNNSNNWYSEMDYVDYTTLFDGNGSFTNYVFSTNSSPKKIRWDGDGRYFTDVVDNGDGKLSVMLLLPSGATFTELMADQSIVSSIDNWTCGDFYITGVISNGAYNHPTFYLINSTTGALLDTLTFTSYDDYSWSIDYSYDSFTIRDNNNNVMWYVCRNVTTFTSINKAYDYVWSPGSRFTDYDTYSESPYLVLFNPNTDLSCRILSPTGMSNEFTLPTSYSNGWDLYRNRETISWYYRDVDTNQPAVKIYDLSGNTLNTFVSTTDNNWNFWTRESSGGITFAVSGEGLSNGTLNVNIINTDGTTDYKTLGYYGLNSYWYQFNDYYWWD